MFAKAVCDMSCLVDWLLMSTSFVDSRDGIEMEDSGLDCEMLNFDLSEPEFTDEEWMSFLKRIPSNC